MDRRTALERLDAVRLGSDDLSEPEMAGLRDALAADGDLRTEFDRRHDWDRGIAAAVRDVPIPIGLKDRLLTRLASAEAVAPPRPTSPSRRRALAALTAVAAALLAGVIYWGVSNSHKPVTVTEARDAASALLSPSAEDTPFNGSFDPKLPSPVWETRLTIAPLRRLGLLAEDGEHRAAAWRVRSGGRAPWQAILVAIPVENVVSPPQAKDIIDRDYVPDGPGSRLRSVSWTQDGFVYICCSDGLDDLISELHRSRLA